RYLRRCNSYRRGKDSSRPGRLQSFRARTPVFKAPRPTHRHCQGDDLSGIRLRWIYDRTTPKRRRRLGHAMSILKGIRVLDCSIAMAGPFAGQRLGDLGADVIKVEPIGGEWQRRTSAGGARGNRVNVSFLSLNRNKRSLAVDLKSKDGQQLIHQLAAKSDVFIQNYRPGVAERLSVDYATLSSINPRLVYVSLSGYGSSGPYANRAGQDLVLQGMSGAMLSAARGESRPAPPVDTLWRPAD